MSNQPGERSGGFRYKCPACGWTTTGWATPDQAAARGAQHAAEHETGDPMPELADFDPKGA